MNTKKEKPVVIVISGPTGVGKTALALRLAQYFKTDIISADSRQCYREMTIGTAKPSEEELALVKHYFINSHSIQEKVTAFDFEKYALNALVEIHLKSKVAVVCGGTGLYIQALCEGLDEMPEISAGIIDFVEAEYKKKGLSWLQEAVSTEDPLFFAAAEQQNPARLLRALAFVRSSGKSITEFKSGKKKERPFQMIKIALEIPRLVLYERINLRVEKMIRMGLEKEVLGLIPFQSLTSLNTVGYSELFAYFRGESSFDFALEKIKQHSRNYAKRQLTWFKKDAANKWFSPDEEESILHYILGKIRSFQGTEI